MAFIPEEQIASSILLVRNQKVMLDADLAKIYGVTTKRLNQQVKRNLHRFPPDFMFQLTEKEETFLRLQTATSNSGRGGRRHLTYVFTEHGAVMLAAVLNSPIAVDASIQVVRAFIRLRQILASHVELSRKVDALEKKFDGQFKSVFDVIRQLMNPPTEPKRRIGIISDE